MNSELKNLMMITIIIVVYKSDANKLNKLLRKIGNKYKIIIIDNSFNYNFNNIKITKKTKIVRSNNIGNGAGINLGIKEAKTPYALYFDIDVDFNKNLIKKLLLKIKEIKNFGILCPNNGRFNCKPKIIENYEFEAPVMLFNIQEFKKIGLFDEKVFLYFEETDLFFKCKKNNKKVFILTDLIINHFRSSSVSIIKKNDINNKIIYLRHWHYMWSMFYYYKKNFGYLYGIKKTIKLFFKDSLMLIYFIITFEKKKKIIRLNRIMGLLSSCLLLKSYKRIDEIN